MSQESRSYSTADINKLKELFNDGMSTMRKIEDLREGLKEAVKAIAEEMEMKPAVLSKALKIAHKNTLQDEKSSFGELEEILEMTGHSL
jgi:hypothetical protein